MLWLTRQAHQPAGFGAGRIAAEMVGQQPQQAFDALDVFRRGRQRFLEKPIGVQPAAAGHHLRRQQHELLQLALGLLRADGDRLEIDIDVQAVQFRQRRLAARRRARLHGGGAEIRGPVGPVPLAQERLNVFWLPGGDMALADFALARIGIR